MATFVLVHGAMHGGWCWGPVQQRLVVHGHEVYRPTLTGQGERRAALSPQVGVATHVHDITELLWFEDLRGVHLVLHSYAGVLAGPLAERAEGRLSAVICLGAFLTDPGECLLDAEPEATAERYRRLAEEHGDGLYVPASDAFLDQWGVTDPSLRALVAPRLTDFPLRCATDHAEYDPTPLGRMRAVYVAHTDPPLASLVRSEARAAAAGWEMRALHSGHDMMLVAPDATAELLHDLAAET